MTHLHDWATLSWRWCYCCRFRMWFQPRCRWSVWSNQMSSGIRRWRTSASGRRRTAWASRWVSRLQLARVLKVSFILTYAVTEHQCWERPEMILDLQKLLSLTWKWLFPNMTITEICPISKAIFQENSGNLSVEPCEASPRLLQTVRVQLCFINMLSTNCDDNFLPVTWIWGMTVSPISWSRSNHPYEVACTTCCSTSGKETVFRAASRDDRTKYCCQSSLIFILTVFILILK